MQRVRKFDAPMARGLRWAAPPPVLIKPLQPGFRPWKTGKPPLRAGENKKTGPAARGNAPLLPPAAASPPEGEILAALCFAMLMRPKAERRADFPLRGKWCVSPIGVHFHRVKRGCMVFAAKGSGAAAGGTHTHRPQGDTFPSEPSEPSEPYEPYEPSEPGRPKGALIKETL